MNKWNFITLATALSFSPALFAGTMNTAVTPIASMMPDSGLFVGLGGSANSVNLSQNVNLVGLSNVYITGILVANGEAQGPAVPFRETDTTFAPQAQLGYFHHFANSDYLWGVKFLYQYVNLTLTDQDVVSPQSGVLTATPATPDTFTGHAIIQSAQASLNHEFILTPFLGRSFKQSYVYLGVGPSLFSTKSRFYDVTGYADINGVHTDVSGTPSNFASSQWMWGGAAQLGMNYYFDSSWSLDFNYTYARSKQYTTDYTGSFVSSSMTGGVPYITAGTLLGTSKQRFITQTFGVSINKTFV